MGLTQLGTDGIKDDAITAAKLASGAAAVSLDAPSVTGDLVALDTGTTTHTISNYSASCSYTIAPIIAL